VAAPIWLTAARAAKKGQSRDAAELCAHVWGWSAHAAQIERLTRKLEQFDACSVHVRDDVVLTECQSLPE
jgi:hypothetical protein